jgi:hypothetical protein
VGVVELIQSNLNLCLIGEFGIGKTHLLKKLAERFNTRVLTSNPSVEELQELTHKKFKSKKNAYSHLLRLKKRVLLFDDVHESRKDTISMILRLCRKHVIICSSEFEIERLIFDFKNFRLNKLSFEESMKLCTKLLKSKKRICEEICKESKGLPLLIVRGIEHYKVTKCVKKYFTLNWRKLLIKRLVVFAYLCLSIRYFARINKNWEVYSLLSTVAYALLAFNRISRKV